jgi:hypothetical protein
MAFGLLLVLQIRSTYVLHLPFALSQTCQVYIEKIYIITYTIRKCVDGAYGIYITNSIQVEQI